MRCDDCRKIIYPWQPWSMRNHAGRRCFHHTLCRIKVAILQLDTGCDKIIARVTALENAAGFFPLGPATVQKNIEEAG